MVAPAQKFEVGQMIHVRLAQPTPDKPDNVTTRVAKIVSAEWGENNKIRLGLQPKWFYRIQLGSVRGSQWVPDGPAIEFSESELQEKVT